LKVDGRPFRVQAGSNGSIQGPCEAKWGYTTLDVADWDHDGLPDIVFNSIWGKVEWLKNIGSKSRPNLSPPQPVRVRWKQDPPKPEWVYWNPAENQLLTQWRTTPTIVDFDKDGLNDLVMLDHEGYLAFYRRARTGDGLVLLPPQRIFRGDGPSVYANRHQVQNKEPGLLRLNDGFAGRSGRRKFCFADWDQDGKLDLLVNSENVHFLQNAGMNEKGQVTFRDRGPVSKQILAGHTTSPTVVDWDNNGVPDLLVGAEDGFFYFLPNPRDAK